jgi:hypothetical protein
MSRMNGCKHREQSTDSRACVENAAATIYGLIVANVRRFFGELQASI